MPDSTTTWDTNSSRGTRHSSVTGIGYPGTVSRLVRALVRESERPEVRSRRSGVGVRKLAELAHRVDDLVGRDGDVDLALALLTHQQAVASDPRPRSGGGSVYRRRVDDEFPGLAHRIGVLPTIRGYADQPRNRGSVAFTFADLFAGIGGFHLALGHAGGRCVFASEWDTNAQVTYAVNHGIVPFGDIRLLTRNGDRDRPSAEIRGDLPKADVIAAGFPCQPFSLAGVSSRNHHGKEHGLRCDTQGTLFHDIVLLAEALEPKVLLLENVKNLASHDGGNTIRVIRDEIESAGYTIFPSNFDDRGWAVVDSQAVSAQRRKRVYMVCVRNDISRRLGPFTMPDFGFDRPASTLRQVIDLDTSMTDDEKFDRFGISERLWRSHLERDRRHRERANGFSTNFMYDLDQPAPTLVARYFKDGKDCLIVDPTRRGRPPRMLTPRECAILQTFPERFLIPEAKSVAYKQFGNSITVEVARRIAKQIASYLRPVIGTSGGRSR